MKKDLKGTDILLNLKEMHISTDSYSSGGSGGNVGFYIDCETKHGYTEDPNFSGKIIILSVKKEQQKGVYTLKVKFVKAKDERWD